jgi:hypothetical protein
MRDVYVILPDFFFTFSLISQLLLFIFTPEFNSEVEGIFIIFLQVERKISA